MPAPMGGRLTLRIANRAELSARFVFGASERARLARSCARAAWSVGTSRLRARTWKRSSPLSAKEMSGLAAEEHALTQALASLDGDGASSPPASASNAADRPRAGNSRTRRPTRSAGTSRRRRRRGASKSTADRMNELRELLADGPKSRNELAAALKVSPARVQQLLAELGSSVSSQPGPEQRRGKLWTLTAGNGARRVRADGPAQ